MQRPFFGDCFGVMRGHESDYSPEGFSYEVKAVLAEQRVAE
jgi:hypothetical protein